MPNSATIGIVSDIHYAGALEQARGDDFESRIIPNPILRQLVGLHRKFIWLNRPLHKGYLLDRFLQRIGPCDYLIANGDYSCNTGFTGVSDDAVFQSVSECLGKLRHQFGERLRANFGDHELGKISFFGGHGGMRLASWRRATQELRLDPFWRLEIGNYVLIGLVSSLVGLPVYEADALPTEWPEWQSLREEHLGVVKRAFAELRSEQRVLLFCHDPTALPFLWREEAVRAKVGQIEQTIIGHLHSNLVLWKSRILAGMPRIGFLGHTARRLSTALNEARHWRPFKVRLCPALAGIQLLNDGGYYTVTLDPDGRRAVEFTFCPMPRP
jgi:hypothetical protein